VNGIREMTERALARQKPHYQKALKAAGKKLKEIIELNRKESAAEIASLISTAKCIPPLTEGYVVKGGQNQGESQIKERPAPPASMIAAAKRSNGHDFRRDDDGPVATRETEGVVVTFMKDGKLQRYDQAKLGRIRADEIIRIATSHAATAVQDNFVIPWSPTIGQPEAANSNVMQINPGDVPPVDTPYVVRAVPDNYTTLRTILDAAFGHAATGKGKERHARDLPFDDQPLLTTTRLVGPGFPLGQAIKKAGEAAGMIERSEYDAAEAECLGAINYLAGAVAWMREQKNEPSNKAAPQRAA